MAIFEQTLREGDMVAFGLPDSEGPVIVRERKYFQDGLNNVPDLDMPVSGELLIRPVDYVDTSRAPVSLLDMSEGQRLADAQQHSGEVDIVAWQTGGIPTVERTFDPLRSFFKA